MTWVRRAALGYAWNFLRTSTTGYQLKDEDQAVVICLRHGATEFAFSNDIWSRYDVLRKEKYQHPETEKPVKGGNVFRPGSAGPKSMDDGFTWDGLARRGVHFAICGSATRGLARSIAGEKADSATMQKMVDELMANAPANAHFMASGIPGGAQQRDESTDTDGHQGVNGIANSGYRFAVPLPARPRHSVPPSLIRSLQCALS